MIGCFCTSFDPKCCVCNSTRAAFKAGLRAYSKGYSRRVPSNWEDYGYAWSNGWEEGRRRNPNTRKAREREAQAKRNRELAALKSEMRCIQKKIEMLS